MGEDKSARFKRLARLRGERILKDIRLLSNLSNRNNYDYTEAEVKTIFSAIEDELRLAKTGFLKATKRRIEL